MVVLAFIKCNWKVELDRGDKDYILHLRRNVYRLYQLTKAAHFMERLMFQMRGLPTTPDLLEKSGALFAMMITFQVLGVVCLWSLMTFLSRLFPSRPVSENYYCCYILYLLFLGLVYS